MVSYYNNANMYRHQQNMSGAPSAPAWYPYHPQQLEQQMWEQQVWHHGPPPPPPPPPPHFDYGEMADPLMPSATVPPAAGSDLSSGAMPSPPPPPPLPQDLVHCHQMQQARPPPARSPFEWIKKTSYQSQPNPGKTRTKDKYRVVYTDLQRVELEKEFSLYNRYITIKRKAELAASLGLSERQIKIWFQNRRAKDRKQAKKRIEEKRQIEELYPPIPHHHYHHHHHLQNLHQDGSSIVGYPPIAHCMMQQQQMINNNTVQLPLKSETSDSDHTDILL